MSWFKRFSRKTTDSPSRHRDDHFMAYIDSEVKMACEAMGHSRQIRRNLESRHKPVSESPVDDYEWKIIPSDPRNLGDNLPDGTYYIIGFNCHSRRFVVQHDTHHCGIYGPHFGMRTFTEILLPNTYPSPAGADWAPPKGWLAKMLIEVVSRFGPNRFSIT